MIVDYRRPARKIVTVELGMRQAAGGLRCPSRLPPHSRCPCRLVGLMVGLHTLHRRPAVHGGRRCTNTHDPLGRRPTWLGGLSRLVKPNKQS